MTEAGFAPFIHALPPTPSRDGVRGHLAKGPDAVVLFYEAERDVELEAHEHGAQWGVVLDGTVELTFEGNTLVLHAGDRYELAAGVRHSAVLRAGSRGIDVFADADRY